MEERKKEEEEPENEGGGVKGEEALSFSGPQEVGYVEREDNR